jgi:hypothetical protein
MNEHRENLGRGQPRVTCDYGYGYGDGYGDGEYWRLALLEGLMGEARDRAARLAGEGCAIAYWRSDILGCPANSGSGDPVSVGMIQEEAGPLNPCNHGTLHATMTPKNWRGDRIWAVAMYPPYAMLENGNKIASLRREILAEVTERLSHALVEERP